MSIKSRNFAAIVGPTLLVLAMTEKLNLAIWTPSIAAVVYLNGLVLFVAGLSIIRFHNVWSGWPAVITATGWLVIAIGLYRLIAPHAPQASANIATDVVFLVMLLVGCFLTFKGYAENGPASRK
ncbi:MAG: hypothetical protein Q8Q26_05630 [Pseudorhodobacter sp.]|nr:hypothetical protein [Pseudorhodobacter sp.]